MTKRIKSYELAEIVTGLLVSPETMGELDSHDAYVNFFEAIGNVVAEHCGGQVEGVDNTDKPTLVVASNDSLPSTESNVWANYDPLAWRGVLTEEESHQVDCDAIDRRLLNRGCSDGQQINGTYFGVEHYRTIALSTSHLLPDDFVYLDAEAADPDDNMILRRDTGYFIKLYHGKEYNRRRAGISESLQNLIHYCHERGFTMIELDCDADAFFGLPVYDEEEELA